MPKHPDPPVQVRELLSVSKRQRVPFDLAWRAAIKRYRTPHDKQIRHDYQAVLEELEGVFRDAYEGRDVPGGRTLVVLQEMLERERESSVQEVRTPPVRVRTERGNREPDVQFNRRIAS